MLVAGTLENILTLVIHEGIYWLIFELAHNLETVVGWVAQIDVQSTLFYAVIHEVFTYYLLHL